MKLRGNWPLPFLLQYLDDRRCCTVQNVVEEGIFMHEAEGLHSLGILVVVGTFNGRIEVIEVNFNALRDILYCATRNFRGIIQPLISVISPS